MSRSGLRSRPARSGSRCGKKRFRFACRCGVTAMALWRQALPAGRDDLCVPQPIRRPPILIAGGGEKKTLRLVAQYAVVWTSTASTVDELKHETDVPNRHCDTVGRNPAEIRKTAGLLSLRRPRRLSEDGAKVRRIGRLLDQCRRDAGQSGPHRVRPAPGRRGRAQAGCDRLARRARIICALLSGRAGITGADEGSPGKSVTRVHGVPFSPGPPLPRPLLV
jgi:hypothetical protein